MSNDPTEQKMDRHPSDDVRKEAIRASAEIAREKQVTLRLVAILVFLAIAVGMILFAVVRMSEQPPWLVLCLAIFGPTGLIVALFTIYIGYLTRRIGQLNRQLDESQLDNANHEEK